MNLSTATPESKPTTVNSSKARHASRRYPFRLARHLCMEYAMPLCGALAAFSMLSLLLAVFDDLPDFNGIQISARLTVLYFLARIPENLAMVFPVSSLLAVSFMSMVMGKNNELTAIRSAGLSLLTTSIPIWCLALMLCLGIFAIQEFIQPACARYIEWIQTDYLDAPAPKKTAKDAGDMDARRNQFAYYNPKNRQEWFFADFQAEGVCRGVSVCTQDEQGRIDNVLTAAQAYYTKDSGWHFRQVSITEYEFDGNSGMTTVHPSRFLDSFPPAETDSPNIYRESPRDIIIQSRTLDTLPLKDLLRMRRKDILLDPRNRALVRTMITYRIFSPLSTLIATLLGFALTLTRGRTSPIRGFVIAIAIFVAYHLLAQLFLVLGKNDFLFWLLAGCFPTLTALAYAFWLAYRRQ